MTTIPVSSRLGEANFSDHGANRLGASALMQGLADGYFVIPYTIGDYLAGVKPSGTTTDLPEFKASEAEVNNGVSRFLNSKGTRTVDSFHRELGLLMWEYCGMARNDAGLRKAIARIPRFAKNSGKMSPSRAPVPSSTNHSNVPAESPTFWSWVS